MKDDATNLRDRDGERQLSLSDLPEPVSKLGSLLSTKEQVLERPDLLGDTSS